eukprot:6756931-Prymnesium_polylepis.1
MLALQDTRQADHPLIGSAAATRRVKVGHERPFHSAPWLNLRLACPQNKPPADHNRHSKNEEKNRTKPRDTGCL